jgi:foldase protein PrsA
VRRTASFLALVVGLGLVAAGCGSGSSYAAKVDGEVISADDLEAEMRSIAANEPYVQQVEARTQVRGTGGSAFDEAFTGQVLGRQIQYVLVDREIERRKLKITPADRQSARTEVAEQAGGEEILKGFPEDYQETLVDRAAKVGRLTVSLSGQAGTDDAAKGYYDSHKEEFTEACVSHILLSTKERADQVRGRLASGEDFAAVARADSLDNLSASQGGDLGCKINADSFAVPEFIKAMLTQPVNEVGTPVQTQYGFHLIKVRSRTVPSFDDVKDRARERVLVASKAKLQEWINTTVAKAKIEVNPKYGTFDKQSLAVKPPATTTIPPATTSPPASGIQPLRP